MQTRINKKQVSHLEIKGTTKGRDYGGYGYVDYIWMEAEYFKFLWLFKTPFKDYEEGYYKNMKRGIMNRTPTKLRENECDLLGEIYTQPKVTVFSGGKEILEKTFDDVETAKEWATKNFPNCEIVER